MTRARTKPAAPLGRVGGSPRIRAYRARRVARTGDRFLRDERPHPVLGMAIVLATVAAATGVLYPLKQVAPVVSLGVVYLLGVLLVSTYGGLRLGVLASLLSAAAFNWFHIPPVHRWHVADTENWVALAAFVIVAAIASSVADVARSRAREAERRRREADLSADLAKVLLGDRDRAAALAAAGELVARSVGARGATIETPAAAVVVEDAVALPLRDGGARIGRLVIHGPLDGETEAMLHERVVRAVEAVLAVVLRRDAVQAEAVETAALRRSDVLKTALLRTVSHDLRSPLTAIVTAGHALLSPTVAPDEREHLTRAVVEEGERLSRLIDKLLDLSRLQAGSAEPHATDLALEDLLEAALGRAADDVSLEVDGELPLLEGDGAQLERAFANLVENAAHHSGRRPVEVRAEAVGGSAVVRIVDRGPGIPAAERAMIFEPFYRGRDAPAGSGSGLGLAIARGFVEANGGRIGVESTTGGGSTFVVTLPLKGAARVPG